MGKKRHVTLTQAQITKMKSDIVDEAMEKALLIFLSALHDEYGFGEKRLCKVLETANRYGEYLDDHLITIREVQKIIEKNTGMKFIRGF